MCPRYLPSQSTNTTNLNCWVWGPKECVTPEGPTGQEGQEGPQGLEHGGAEGASQRAQTMGRLRGGIKAQQGDPGPEEGRRGQGGWRLVPGVKRGGAGAGTEQSGIPPCQGKVDEGRAGDSTQPLVYRKGVTACGGEGTPSSGEAEVGLELPWLASPAQSKGREGRQQEDGESSVLLSLK